MSLTAERAARLLLRVLRSHGDVIYLTAVILASTGLCLFWAAHDADSTGRKFCAIIQLATSHPVPRPADPKANPSRQQNYLGYIGAVNLGRSLGCKEPRP